LTHEMANQVSAVCSFAGGGCPLLARAKDHQPSEEALRRSGTLFEQIYEHSPDAMILVDGNGRMERVNAQAETSFTQSREHMLGSLIEMLIPERLRDRHSALRGGYVRSRPRRHRHRLASAALGWVRSAGLRQLGRRIRRMPCAPSPRTVPR
jgi:PAS domain S-box-containing protein